MWEFAGAEKGKYLHLGNEIMKVVDVQRGRAGKGKVGVASPTSPALVVTVLRARFKSRCFPAFLCGVWGLDVVIRVS